MYKRTLDCAISTEWHAFPHHMHQHLKLLPSKQFRITWLILMLIRRARAYLNGIAYAIYPLAYG